MLIVMHHWATDKDIEAVKKTIHALGLRPIAIPGAERTAVGVIGNRGWVDDAPFRDIKAVAEILHVTKPYKLVSRDFHPSDTVIRLDGSTSVGGMPLFSWLRVPWKVESTYLKRQDFSKKLGSVF